MFWNRIKKMHVLGILTAIISCLFVALPSFAEIALPTLNVGMQPVNSPREFSQGVQILILLTILSLAPSILIMTTSFTRIIIVLALTRQAIGTNSLPPPNYNSTAPSSASRSTPPSRSKCKYP